MFVYIDKCEEFGLDVKQVEKIARMLSRAGKEAGKLGLGIFGGSGHGSLRLFTADKQGPGHSEVASLDGHFDGGDGGDVF